METPVKKHKKKNAPKGIAIFKKMMEDKKAISKHIRKGGTFKELREKGYKFATV